MKIKTIIYLILFILSQTLYAQVELKINLKNRCIFTGGVMDDELYKFEGNAQVETWIKEILLASGSEQNFKIIQTNVENVSAVIDGNKRYLLYPSVIHTSCTYATHNNSFVWSFGETKVYNFF